MGGALGSSWIALAMFGQIVFSYKVKMKVVAAVITFQWLVMFVMAAIGPLWIARNGGPFCERRALLSLSCRALLPL